MSRRFKGRAVLAGRTEGEALVTHFGFNTLAAFYNSMNLNTKTAICSDQDNPNLFGKVLTDKILCLSKTIGSTSAGATWDRIVHCGLAPKAMLFSERIDSLAAAGLIIADVWMGIRVYTIDQLGDEFLEYVRSGQRINIETDGSVIIA